MSLKVVTMIRERQRTAQAKRGTCRIPYLVASRDSSHVQAVSLTVTLPIHPLCCLGYIRAPPVHGSDLREFASL